MGQDESFQGIAAVRLAINDVKHLGEKRGRCNTNLIHRRDVYDLLIEHFSLSITAGPIVSGAAAVLGQVDVFRIVELLVLRVHDVVDDAGLQIEQDRTGNVVFIIGLQNKIRGSQSYHTRQMTWSDVSLPIQGKLKAARHLGFPLVSLKRLCDL